MVASQRVNGPVTELIVAAPERFDPVFSNEDYRVYRIVTDRTSPAIPASADDATAASELASDFSLASSGSLVMLIE
jgi:hypothetical protein